MVAGRFRLEELEEAPGEPDKGVVVAGRFRLEEAVEAPGGRGIQNLVENQTYVPRRSPSFND